VVVLVEVWVCAFAGALAKPKKAKTAPNKSDVFILLGLKTNIDLELFKTINALIDLNGEVSRASSTDFRGIDQSVALWIN